MLDFLSYLWKEGIATQSAIFPELDESARGLPKTDFGKPCRGTECGACVDVCPTDAIKVTPDKEDAEVELDLGKCIGCGLCVSACPTELIVRNSSTKNAVVNKEELILSNKKMKTNHIETSAKFKYFRNSLAVRVVSTGCSACDLEIGAAGNPIFDMERFGISIVASPRMADALLVTGPVGKGMQEALLRTYEAMAEPRLVIACGTCAISGGVHAGGYAEAGGVGKILPVDVYIPGCPPHPWSIIFGLMQAMGRQ